jgi:HK97 family phage portal protein
VLPALTEAVSTIFRGARNALKESGPNEFSITRADEGKDYGGGISFDAQSIAWYARNGYGHIAAMLGGGAPTWAGESVSLQSALNHSVVWACNRLISETQGATPLVMQQQKGDAVRAATDHPMFNALLHAPNDEMSSMSFQESRTSHCALQGNAFAHIIRRSGTETAIELQALDPSQVRVDREKGGQKRLVYIVKTSPDGVDGNNETTYTLQRGKPHDILHIRGLGWDGLVGHSVISMARQSFGTAIAIEKNVAAFYANGGRVPYHLEMARRFKTEQEFQKFRQDWQAAYSKPHNSPILEEGTKYVQDGLSAVDQQMLESRLFDIHEICRWFLMSPHLVGDLSRATFSNIEELFLEFASVTMGPWFNRWEKDCWRCILTSDEKSAGYQFKHDTTELRTGAFLSHAGLFDWPAERRVHPKQCAEIPGPEPVRGRRHTPHSNEHADDSEGRHLIATTAAGRLPTVVSNKARRVAKEGT